MRRASLVWLPDLHRLCEKCSGARVEVFAQSTNVRPKVSMQTFHQHQPFHTRLVALLLASQFSIQVAYNRFTRKHTHVGARLLAAVASVSALLVLRARRVASGARSLQVCVCASV